MSQVCFSAVAVFTHASVSRTIADALTEATEQYHRALKGVDPEDAVSPEASAPAFTLLRRTLAERLAIDTTELFCDDAHFPEKVQVRVEANELWFGMCGSLLDHDQLWDDLQRVMLAAGTTFLVTESLDVQAGIFFAAVLIEEQMHPIYATGIGGDFDSEIFMAAPKNGVLPLIRRLYEKGSISPKYYRYLCGMTSEEHSCEIIIV